MSDIELTLSEYEQMFDVKPVGIKYICEFCKEGEQIAVPGPIIVKDGELPKLKEHKCNKCGKTMMLPKSYPYIEWVPIK